MKKSLIIMFLVVVMASIGVVGIGTVIAGQAELVYLEEEILLGEKEDASDICFQLNTQWQGKLLWETRGKIDGKTETETTFSFHPAGLKYDYGTESEVSLEYHTGFGYSSSGEILNRTGDRVPYLKVFLDVAERTETGEERTETVRLADYYEYYEFVLNWRSDKYARRTLLDVPDENAYISQVLAVKVPEDMLLEATVYKNDQGIVNSVDGNLLDADIRIYSGGTVLMDGCYVFIYGMDGENFLPGLSEKGYGIYRLPFHRQRWDDEDVAAMKVEEFSLVYPMEERMLALSADATEQELFLLIDREGELILQRIDKESCTLLQEFSLGSSTGLGRDECRDMEITEKGVFILTYNGRVFFAEKQGEQYVSTVTFDLSDQVFYGGSSQRNYAYDYKDGRLALIWMDNSQFIGNSVYVFVLEKEEMKYLAHYRNSLDQVRGNYDYGNRPHDAEPFSIWFCEAKF